MKIAQARMSIGPALPRPAPAPEAQPASIAELPGLSLGAFAAPPDARDGWLDQCSEGVATLLDAKGEHGAWHYAVAGGAIGVVAGVIGIAEARRHGDEAGLHAGLLKLSVGSLGVLAGSGVLHAHPSLQAAVEAVRAVLGSAKLPEKPAALTTYGGIGRGLRRR